MLEKALHSFNRHFLYSSRFFQFFFGVLPNTNSTKRFSIFLIFFIFCLPLFIQMCYQLIMMNFKLELATKLLQKLIIAMSFFCIQWFLYLCTEINKQIFGHVKKDYELVSDKEELKIIEKYTKESEYYAIIMIVCSYGYVMIISLPTLIKVILYELGIFDDIHLTLPITMNDNSDISLLYYCMLIYQIIILFMIVPIMVLIISSYFVFVLQASSQFSIIRMKIRRPFIKDHFNDKRFNDECDWMIDIIKRYKRVTQLIDLINAMSEKILLVSVFFMMLQIIVNFICMLRLSFDTKNMSDKIELIIFMSLCFFTVYIYFYVGQKLLDHSTITFNEFRKVPFYMFSIRNQKLFLFLITRSLKPCYISIGGLYIFSHEVFAALLQRAFSFATVFYSIRS